jgi:hypothetical protein
VATLTYVYADSTAVVGPLSRQAEPHTYDLCGDHAGALGVPVGWTIVRLPGILDAEELAAEDLYALADATHEASAPGRPRPAPAARPEQDRPHLRLVQGSPSD